MPDELPPDTLKDHDYDGIQEYDNQLPGWLMWMFYLACIWAVWYFAHFHFNLFEGMLGTGRLGPAELAHQDALVAKRIAALDTGPATEEELLAEYQDPARIENGSTLWQSAGCASCHTAELWGDIGPNLRDGYWIHPNNLTSMVDTITKGRANGQMPAHEGRLTRREIQNLVFFVVDTNQQTDKQADGTTAQGKQKQGELKPFPFLSEATQAADTESTEKTKSAEVQQSAP